MSMHCPLCDEKLEAKDHREAYGEVPAHWLCKACDCRVNLWDDEYDLPDSAKDAPAELG